MGGSQIGEPAQGTQTLLNARDIASLFLGSLEVQLPQTEHRIKMIEKWAIPNGAKVVEFGCGQGDCTAVLAELVGPNGHVTGVDPAPPTYGAPWTVAQMRAHLSAGRLGPRMTWKEADSLEFLQSTTECYDVAVLAHCVWYFSSPKVILETFRLLSTRVKYVCIAEWSLVPTNPGSHIHVTAALTQAALEWHRPEEDYRLPVVPNIRTAISPAGIKEIAVKAGLVFDHDSESLLVPGKYIDDGRWEIVNVNDPKFWVDVKKMITSERDEAVIQVLKDTMNVQLSQFKGGAKAVESMDVWCGRFKCTGNL